MGSTPLSGVLETLATIGFKNKFGILNFWVILMVVMKTQQNNKTTMNDFKLKKQAKGWYVAEGMHKGKNYHVECEDRASRYDWVECVGGYYVIVHCDGKFMWDLCGYRLKDVRWALANDRDNFLIED